jgi:hypothetical protein
MLGIIQAARRYSPGRGAFRTYARTYSNGAVGPAPWSLPWVSKVYHFLPDKEFLIKVPASWRELHALGQKLPKLWVEASEVPVRLYVSIERWREIADTRSQRITSPGDTINKNFRDSIA